MDAEDRPVHLPERRRLILTPWPDGSLGNEYIRRAEALANGEWTSLTEGVLVGHLLLEQALTIRIQAKFARPDVLIESRLTFAQLITVYAGLYDPEESGPRTPAYVQPTS